MTIDLYNAFLYRDVKAKGGPGPIEGLSIGVKANIAVENMPFHAGIASWKRRRANKDAEVVRRLREAGGMICGILNMEEAALGAKTDNPYYGPTQNPHRHGYSPGGSSGGSGAAVAAGLCDAALGTDTLGSVRIPASHCGVYGFKPATDHVSQEGLIAADPAFDAIGPLARDLDLLERVARCMSEFGDSPIVGNGATLVDHGVEIDPAVAAVFSHVFTILPDRPGDVSLSEKNSRIRFAAFIKVARRLSGELRDATGLSPRLRQLLAYGLNRPETKFAQDMDILGQTQFEVRRIIAEHGFLILPTVPIPPFPLRDPEPPNQADFTCLANIAGLPAISIPAGWTGDGLPVGVQIMGDKGAEAGLFALARKLDSTLQAYRPPTESKGA